MIRNKWRFLLQIRTVGTLMVITPRPFQLVQLLVYVYMYAGTCVSYLSFIIYTFYFQFHKYFAHI